MATNLHSVGDRSAQRQSQCQAVQMQGHYLRNEEVDNAVLEEDRHQLQLLLAAPELDDIQDHNDQIEHHQVDECCSEDPVVCLDACVLMLTQPNPGIHITVSWASCRMRDQWPRMMSMSRMTM